MAEQLTKPARLGAILAECEEVAFDLEFKRAKQWREAAPDRLLVGYLPIYIPREVLHAANALPVGIMGAGDRKQIIKGDAYYQSYICHLPRGVIEMALDSNLVGFDGFLFPAICDCVRNLSGMFKLAKKGSSPATSTIRRTSPSTSAAPSSASRSRRSNRTCSS
ncbi:MAG: 2-hydroxyacyl-CoA dehydratase [Flavobacteriales bacterium]|nr:2-hydroxyacyl-CoA dehydratase [Flavobacteriales bacterium]